MDIIHARCAGPNAASMPTLISPTCPSYAQTAHRTYDDDLWSEDEPPLFMSP